MKKRLLSENIADLGEVIKRYIDARINLFKLGFIQRASKAGTYFITMTTILIGVLFFLMLIAFAFSFWYGRIYGNIWEGFLISAGVLIILLVLFFVFRKLIITNSIIRQLSEIVFQDENNEEE